MVNKTNFCCFISHPWAGYIHHFAIRLTIALRQRQISVWIDEEQMRAGQPISQRQTNGIVYESDIFIFVLAPETLNSKNCMEELNVAIDNQKPMICTTLEECTIPSPLLDYITVDFSAPSFFESSVDKLVIGAKNLYEVQQITEILSDVNPENRIEAARILADLRDPVALRSIIERVQLEHDDSVVYWLLVAIGDLAEPNDHYGKIALQLLNDIEKTGSHLLKQGVDDARKEINRRLRPSYNENLN